MVKQYPFPVRLRLKKKNRITQVFQQGQHFRTGLLQAKALPALDGESKFLISVRKSVGNAPQRNRLKRLVREVLRKHRGILKDPYDICFFILHRPQEPVRLGQVEADIRSLFKRLYASKQSIDAS